MALVSSRFGSGRADRALVTLQRLFASSDVAGLIDAV
jgi:hypothetical protein